MLKKIFIVIAIVAVVGLGFYFAGYRVGENFKISKVGYLTVENAPADVKIFVDGRSQDFEIGDNTYELRLSAGDHSILVSKDGYWPWLKDISVRSGEKTVVRPFLMPQGASVSVITNSDPNYSPILASIRSRIPPTEPADRSVIDAVGPIEAKIREIVPDARISDDRKSAIWVSNGTIKAAWLSEDTPPAPFCANGECVQIIDVFKSPLEIRNIEFMKGRNDVFLIGASEGVYAIEFDKTGIQNFQPIYENSDLRFVRNADYLYILNGNNDLLRIPI